MLYASERQRPVFDCELITVKCSLKTSVSLVLRKRSHKSDVVIVTSFIRTPLHTSLCPFGARQVRLLYLNSPNYSLLFSLRGRRKKGRGRGEAASAWAPIGRPWHLHLRQVLRHASIAHYSALGRELIGFLVGLFLEEAVLVVIPTGVRHGSSWFCPLGDDRSITSWYHFKKIM